MFAFKWDMTETSPTSSEIGETGGASSEISLVTKFVWNATAKKTKHSELHLWQEFPHNIHSQEAEINEYVRQPLEQGFQGWDWLSKSAVSWGFCYYYCWLFCGLQGTQPPRFNTCFALSCFHIEMCAEISSWYIYIFIYLFIYTLYTVHVVLQGCLIIDDQDWKHNRIRMHGCILYMWPLMGR